MKKKIARVKTQMLKTNLKTIQWKVAVFDQAYNHEEVVTKPLEDAVNQFYFQMIKAGIDPTTVHITFTIG